jgi:hypothetical protein
MKNNKPSDFSVYRSIFLVFVFNFFLNFKFDRLIFNKLIKSDLPVFVKTGWFFTKISIHVSKH